MSNKLILRKTNSPFSGQYADVNQGSVLSHAQLDGNFIYLKGHMVYSGTTDGTILKLHKLNNTSVDIDLSSLIEAGDTYLTGGTYDYTAGTITFVDNTGGTFTVTGVQFTGNTSASCITDLYVSNVYGCSPVTYHNSIESSNSFNVNNQNSISFGEGTTASGSEIVNVPTPITIVSACTFTTSDPYYSYPAIVFSGDVSSIWQAYVWNYCPEFLISGSSGTEILNSGCSVYDIYFDSGFTYVVDSSLTGNNYTFISGDTLYDVPTAIQRASYAYGFNTTASGVYSHAEGYSSTASGNSSHAEGRNTIAASEASHAEGFYAQALGTNSHAEGYFTTTLGSGSHAEGYYTITNGNNSHAEGEFTKALNSAAHAEGNSTTASGYASHAEGNSSTAYGTISHAEGYFTTSTGNYSHSEGYITKASGNSSHSEGNSTVAGGQASHSEGLSTTASGNYGSHAEGYLTTASGDYGSHAEGYATTASGAFGHAEGGFSKALGSYSHAEGNNTTSNGNGSHSEGQTTLATGNASHAEGASTTASGNMAHAEGFYTIASGNMTHTEGYASIASAQGAHAEGGAPDFGPSYSGGNASNRAAHAEGIATSASGLASHAEGYQSKATGDYSHAEGAQATASGSQSHAEGTGVRASGSQSHAEGNFTLASGTVSHAEGSYTTASGFMAHGEGSQTTASGQASHSEGSQTTASGNQSHSEGFFTIASGTSAHAEGSITRAGGQASHAEGLSTIASGAGSHAEGSQTTASGEHSHAEGSLTTASGQFSHSSGNYTLASGVASYTSGAGYNDKTLGVKLLLAAGNTSFAHFKITNSAIDRGAQGDYSVVLGGTNHNINLGGHYSGIFVGDRNIISTNVVRSAIIGGQLITGVTNDTVYVPNLNINYAPANDNALTQVLVRASDGTVKYKSVSSFTDMTVTGGTYDANTGVATFTNNSGGTFTVSGFLTGMTDTYTTGVTVNGTTLEFNRTNGANAYSVNLSGITQSKYAASVPFTGGTVQTITHNLNDVDVIVQLKDSTGKLIIPDEVNNYTLNSVDIKVSSTETYRVIIIG